MLNNILSFAISLVRMDHLSEAARSNQDAIRGTQDEIAEYRRQLQSRTIELETLRGTKESLERQRMESEDRHYDDLKSLQAGHRHKHLTYMLHEEKKVHIQCTYPTAISVFELWGCVF